MTFKVGDVIRFTTPLSRQYLYSVLLTYEVNQCIMKDYYQEDYYEIYNSMDFLTPYNDINKTYILYSEGLREE